MNIGGVPLPLRSEVAQQQPSDLLENLVLWLDATPAYVTQSAGLLSAFSDRSGLGNHGVANSPLIYDATGLNNQPTIVFLGQSGQYITIPNSSSLQISGSMTFYGVVAYSVYGDNQHRCILEKGPHGAPTTNNRLNYYFGKGNHDPSLPINRQHFNAQIFTYVNATPRFCGSKDSTYWQGVNNQPVLLTTVVDKPANTVAFYVNGAHLSTVIGGLEDLPDGSYSPDPLNYVATSTVGAQIGAAQGDFYWFVGNISEIRLYASVAHSASEVAIVSNILRSKWGI